MIRVLRSAARQVPGLRWAYRKAYDLSLRMKSSEQVFTDIYRHNKWFGTDSVSGVGSDVVQTSVIVEEIPRLLKEFSIETLLDVPCGDFFWMSRIELGTVHYVGGDIVQELVERNLREHARPGVDFRRIDLTSDDLPEADLVLVRDCLVHLSYEDIDRALRNICKSRARYLLTTTFPGRTNHDIPTGRWRPLDLQSPPFGLPAPERLINEGCTEAGAQFRDKSLALWQIDDLAASLGISRDGY
jgi:SAM-dependent methyltransferase